MKLPGGCRGGERDRRLDGVLQPAEVEHRSSSWSRTACVRRRERLFLRVRRGGRRGFWATPATAPIDGTDGSFDLYWIAIHRNHQSRGFGQVLMSETERMIRKAGGRRVYAETSGRLQYEPTRVFYERLGFFREAHLKDFYAPATTRYSMSKVL